MKLALPFLIRHQSTCSCGQTRRTLQYAVIALFRPSHLSYGARLTPVPFPKGLTGGACTCFHWLSGLPAHGIKRVATGACLHCSMEPKAGMPLLTRWRPPLSRPYSRTSLGICRTKDKSRSPGSSPDTLPTDRQTTAHREEVGATDGEHF